MGWALAVCALVVGAGLGAWGGRRGDRAVTTLAAVVGAVALVRVAAWPEIPFLWDALIAVPVGAVGLGLGWVAATVGVRQAAFVVVGLVVAAGLAEGVGQLALPDVPMRVLAPLQRGVLPCGRAPDPAPDDARPVVLHVGDSMPACSGRWSFPTLTEHLDTPDVRHDCVALEGQGPDLELECLEVYLAGHDAPCAIVWHLFPGNDLTDLGLPIQHAGGRRPFVLDADGRAVPSPPSPPREGWWSRAVRDSAAPALLARSAPYSLVTATLQLRVVGLRQRLLGRVADPMDPRGTPEQHALLDAVLRRAVEVTGEAGIPLSTEIVPNRLAFGDSERAARHREAAAILHDAATRAGLPPLGSDDWLVRAEAEVDPTELYLGDAVRDPDGGFELPDPHFAGEGHRRWAEALAPLMPTCGTDQAQDVEAP